MYSTCFKELIENEKVSLEEILSDFECLDIPQNGKFLEM